MVSHVRRRRTRREVALFVAVLAVLGLVCAAIVWRASGGPSTPDAVPGNPDAPSQPGTSDTPGGPPSTVIVNPDDQSPLRPAAEGATPDGVVVLTAAVSAGPGAPPPDAPVGTAPDGPQPPATTPGTGTGTPGTNPDSTPGTGPDGTPGGGDPAPPVDGPLPESVTPPAGVDVADPGAAVIGHLVYQVYSAMSGWQGSAFYLPAEAGLPAFDEVTTASENPSSLTDLARHAAPNAKGGEVAVKSLRLYSPTSGDVPAPVAVLADSAVVEVLIPWAAVVTFGTPDGDRTVSVAAVMHATVDAAGQVVAGPSTLDDPAWGALTVS